MIDLRSDTVTRPSQPMFAAMSAAPVGDDVWGDDPTVLALQATLASRTGKEAGLFFPSGTQSNLAALMAHCERGDEYIVGQLAHTYKYEGGGAAVLGSIQPQPIENAPDGTLPLAKIAAAIKPLDNHFARTRLLALENTIGGQVLPEGYVHEAVAFARSRGLSAHLDGARVCNAAVASGRGALSLSQAMNSRVATTSQAKIRKVRVWFIRKATWGSAKDSRALCRPGPWGATRRRAAAARGIRRGARDWRAPPRADGRPRRRRRAAMPRAGAGTGRATGA